MSGSEVPSIYLGCAGWSVPKAYGAAFPPEGSHFERYSQAFNAVEINSSFYKPHRSATYQRWAASSPQDFRFSAKIPKEITHVRRLVECSALLESFLTPIRCLGEKLGPLLVQLPPSLEFSPSVAHDFFSDLRARFDGLLAVEPRHPTWFDLYVDTFLEAFRVARVAADPEIVPAAGIPGGWQGIHYYRLHGSPHVYYSGYTGQYLELLTRKLIEERSADAVWCIFDNTALGEATGNALHVSRSLLRSSVGAEAPPSHAAIGEGFQAIASP